MTDPHKLSTLQRFIGGRVVSVTALVTAAVTVAFTDAQGLAAVLVLMIASGTALRSGRRASVLVTACAGGLFVAVIARPTTSSPRPCATRTTGRCTTR